MIINKKKLVWTSCVFVMAVMLAIAFLVNANVTARAEDKPSGNRIINVYTPDDAFECLPVSDSECKIKLKDNTIENVRVPKTVNVDGVAYTVTEVAANGFSANATVKTVLLPSTVKKIGSAAFLNCKQLEVVYAPYVEEMGINVFAMCPVLKDIIFPRTLQKVGGTLFLRSSVTVHARFDSAPEGWAANWNVGNGIAAENQDFNNLDENGLLWKHDFIYEEGPQTYSRSITPVKKLAPLQPFYENINHGDEVITADVREVWQFAFMGCEFNSILIESAAEPINLQSCAFYGVNVTNGIIINREVTYFTYEDKSTMVFSSLNADYITLPTPSNIVEYMFNASTLNNINFICDNTSEFEERGVVKIPETVSIIGEGAFTQIIGITDIYITDKTVVGKAAFEDWTTAQTIHIPFFNASVADNVWTGWRNGCSAQIVGSGSLTCVSMPAEIANPFDTYHVTYKLTMQTKEQLDNSVLYFYTIENNSPDIDYALEKTEEQNEDGSFTRTCDFTLKLSQSGDGGGFVAIKIQLKYNGEIIEEHTTSKIKVHFIFRTGDDFKKHKFADNKNFVLNNEINYYLFSDVHFDTWTTENDMRTSFMRADNYGKIYGNGYTVYTSADIAVLPANSGMDTGIFYKNYGEIHDLNVQTSVSVKESASGKYTMGTVRMAGIAHSNENDGIIDNCELTMISDINCTGAYIGGVAYENSGIIQNCVVRGTSKAGETGDFSGGIVSVNWEEGTVDNCVNYADLSGFCNIGGIAAMSYGNVTSCKNYGNITLSYKVFVNSGSGEVTRNNGSAGGVIGYNSSVTALCADSHNYGTVKFDKIFAGSDESRVTPAMARVIGRNEKGRLTGNYAGGRVDAGPLKQIDGVDQRVWVKDAECGYIE